MPFETYTSLMNHYFMIAKKDEGESLSHQHKVEYPVKGIKMEQPCIQACVAVILHTLRKNFDRACNFLSTMVTQLYAGQQLEVQQQTAKKHSISSVYGRHGEGNQGCTKWK